MSVRHSEQYTTVNRPQFNTPNPPSTTPPLQAEHTVIETKDDTDMPIKQEEMMNPQFNTTEDEEEVKPPPSKQRLVSLDILRGLTIILMITANYQTEDPFPQLEHAEWFGMTLADSIFPSFLFIMGCAIPFALRNNNHETFLSTWVLKIFKRSCLLYGIGLFLNGFPFTRDELESTYRYTGVLPRLAICYLVNATIYLICQGAHSRYSIRNLYLYLVYPLSCLIMWLSLTYGLPSPSDDCDSDSMLDPSYCSIQGMIDRLIWGQQHNYQQAEYDPEGSLSTITSLINCWFGMILGQYFMNNPIINQPQDSNGGVNVGKLLLFKRMGNLLLISVLLMFLSYSLESWIPISKNLWTPSFVLLSSGCSLALLCTLIYVVDINSSYVLSKRPLKFVYNALLKVGRNPLLIYILSELLIASLTIPIMRYPVSHPYAVDSSTDLLLEPDGSSDLGLEVAIEEESIWGLMFRYGLQSWLPTNLASLLFSQLFIWIIFVPISWGLDYKKWYFKV